VPEAEILDALDIAHSEIKKLVAAMRELGDKAGKSPKLEVETPQVDEGLLEQIKGSHGQKLDEATSVEDKLARQDATKAVEEEILAQYSGPEDAPEYGEARGKAQLAFDKLEKAIIRERIAIQKKRPDGRGTDEIRAITIEAGLLPRTHGSALFTRGQTQALSVAALGTTREEMRLDTLGLETSKRYFHHYNFPPFSVGEAGFMRGPKRRDIGHGALAERALVPMIPDQEKFPYTIRVVSDILESNGSSSMASICGSSLSLMDAGVPLTRPVAGIAMGLIKEGDDYVVLSDIAGVEDHLGDMDFKVAGTADGITALQMDIKITGVTFEILTDALEQANKGRQFILGKMAEAIDGPREQLSQHAPRIESIKIDQEKIGAVIGKGGETIRALCEEFEAEIDVEDDGTIRIYAPTGSLVEACVGRIQSMTKEAEVGDRYESAKVVKTTTFGAFVELVKGTDGLLHISNVKPGERVDSVDDVLTSGEEIDVTVVEVDRERGRIGLRLSDDPSIAGKSPEELATVGSGGGGGSRNGGDRGGRGGGREGRRPRGGDREQR
jgi:polyribonucleotide nucleotidyltransferase